VARLDQVQLATAQGTDLLWSFVLVRGERVRHDAKLQGVLRQWIVERLQHDRTKFEVGVAPPVVPACR
jgi:hypothetical protein